MEIDVMSFVKLQAQMTNIVLAELIAMHPQRAQLTAQLRERETLVNAVWNGSPAPDAVLQATEYIWGGLFAALGEPPLSDTRDGSTRPKE